MHVALREAAAAGLFPPGTISTEWTPDPLNIFMNVPITTPLDRRSGGGKIQCIAPESKPGEYIILRAEMDCVAVMSACPNDVIAAVNGGHCTEAEYECLAMRHGEEHIAPAMSPQEEGGRCTTPA